MTDRLNQARAAKRVSGSVLRWLLLSVALAIALGLWAAVGAEDGEAEEAVPAVAQPTGLSALAYHDAVILTWDDPGNAGITHYEVWRRTRDQYPWPEFVALTLNTGSAATSFTDATVSPWTQYDYQVRAVTAQDSSALSSRQLVVTARVPLSLSPDASGANWTATLTPESWLGSRGRSALGYSVWTETGALSSTAVVGAAEPVEVQVVALYGTGADRLLYIGLSRRLNPGATLVIGQREYILDDSPERSDAGTWLYSWPETELQWTAGTAVEAQLKVYAPLTLDLTSSRDLCTANTLTELSWEIAGGMPPYTLTIEGETVDAEAESHGVNCGPIPTDPLTGELIANPTKTFSAMVTDSRDTVASAVIEVALTALSYPDETTILRYQTYDPTGAAATPGSYAFLTGSGDGVRAVTRYEDLRDGTATGLRINVSDASGASHRDHYDTVAVADIIEWRQADDCFVRYQVTAMELEPAGTSGRRFGIESMTYAFTGCSGAIPANAAVTLNFGSLPHLGGPDLLAPVVHGVYQIVPAGWSGPTKAHVLSEQPTSYPDLRRTRDITEARQMRHWREITVPAGWQFDKADEGGAEISPIDGYCAWYVTGAGETGLKVCATKGSRIWFGASKAAWHDGTSVRETRIVADRPASVIYNERRTFFPLTLRVYDAATQVEYTIYGRDRSLQGGNVDAVIAIAESLFAVSHPFGQSTSASRTSLPARGSTQAPVLFEFNVFAGAPTGSSEIRTRGWHGPPYGNDGDSQLDDGALDWNASQGTAVQLLVEPQRFVPSSPIDHVAGRVLEISSPGHDEPNAGCAHVSVVILRYDGYRETKLGQLYYWHVIPNVEVGEQFILSGAGLVSHQLGTVAASPWIPPVNFTAKDADDNLARMDKVVQYLSIGNQTYRVMYSATFQTWLEWKWHPVTTTPSNSDGQRCLTIGDHLHQGADGSGVWPNKNSTAYASNDLLAYDDDGFGFDPDGDGYEATHHWFCSDTWVAKIRPPSAAAPLASPVSRCGAPDNAPVDLTAEPGHQTLTLTWRAPALVTGEDDPISGYRVRWRQATPVDTAWSDWADTDGTSSHELTGLTNGNAYAAQVQATNTSGVGPPSTVTATPLSTLIPPVVTSFTLAGSELLGTFSWRGTSPREVWWELRRDDREDGDFSDVVERKRKTMSPVTFDDPKAGYWYRLTGQACEQRTQVGRGSGDPPTRQGQVFEICGEFSEFSDAVRVELQACSASGLRSDTSSACVPDVPTGVSAIDRASESLTITWSQALGAVSYDVRLDEDDATVASANEQAGDRTHVFAGLNPRQAYDVQVRAVRGSATSHWSDAVESYTLLPAPTIKDDEVSVTHETATLVWEAVTGADGYDVKRTGDTTEDDVQNAISYLFEGLESSTDYTFSVRARLSTNANITSAWTHHEATTLSSCVDPRPTEPESTRIVVEDTQTRWAEPVNGVAAEEQRELRQSQTRTVTWNGEGCDWDTSAWVDDGTAAWSTWTATGVINERPDPEKRTVTVSSSYSWDVRGDSAYQQVTTTKRDDARPYVWRGAPTNDWQLGSWELGTPYLEGPADTGVTNERPDDEERTVTVSSRYSWDVRGDTAHQQLTTTKRDDVRPYVWRGAPTNDWQLGSWELGTAYLEGPTDTGVSNERPDDAERTVTMSSSFSWDVRGDTAYEQVTRTKRDDIRPYVWRGAPTNDWQLGSWELGTAYLEGPTDTGVTNERPDSRERTVTVSSSYSWDVRDNTAYQQLTTTKRDDVRPYVWRGAPTNDWRLGSWELGTAYPEGPTDTGVTNERPDSQERTVTVSSSYSWDVRGDTAYQQVTRTKRDDVRPYVWRSAPTNDWQLGSWELGTPYPEGPTDTGVTNERPDDEERTVTVSSRYSWDVRGNTAYQQVARTKRDDVRPYVWQGAPTNDWGLGSWQLGTAYDDVPTDTGHTLVKPDDFSYSIPPRFVTITEWRMEYVPPFFECVRYEVSQTNRIDYRYTVTYSWGGSSWVSKIGETATTTFGPWRRTGNTGACASARSDGAATLTAGEYVLAWESLRITFTVPEGAAVELSGRALEGGGHAAILTVKGGAELVIGSDALSGTAEEREARFTGTSDSTLSAIAGSLQEVPELTAQPSETVTRNCSEVSADSNVSTSIDLDSLHCAVVRGAGDITIQIGEASNALSLGPDRDWVVSNATGSQSVATPTVTVIDIATGGYVTLSLADGAELARHVPEGNTELGPLFDAIVQSDG